MVQNWSYERDEENINVKEVSSEPDISLSLWTKAYQWAKEGKEVVSEGNFFVKLISIIYTYFLLKNLKCFHKR